jgi:hypothetical protein
MIAQDPTSLTRDTVFKSGYEMDGISLLDFEFIREGGGICVTDIGLLKGLMGCGPRSGHGK